MELVFLVIAIAILQSSQSQSANNEKNAQIPQSNQFGSDDDTLESLRRGNWKRGRYDYDVNVDLDIDDYFNRDVPYHEGYMSARIKSSRDQSTGNKGHPPNSKLKEVHILKFPTDPKAVFLYIPFNSAVRPSAIYKSTSANI